MAGRAVTFLLPRLQPILLLFLFYILLPGRETQDNLDFLRSVPDPVIPEQLFSIFWFVLQGLATTIFHWTFETGRDYVIQVLALLFVVIHSIWIGPSILRHVRKHGRWKHRKFFPSTFFLLSSVALNHLQVGHALQYPPAGRANRLSTRLMLSKPSSFQESSSDFDDTLFPSATELFNQAVDPLAPTDSFFYDDFFEFLPFEEYDSYDPVPAKFLHLSGYADEWISEFTSFDPSQPDPDDEEDLSSRSDDDSTSPSTTSTSISSSTSSEFDDTTFISFFSQRQLSPDSQAAYDYLEPQLRNGPVTLNPAYKFNNVDHLVDMKLYLRHTGHVHTAQENVRIIPILIDTGCSVATSGFIDDFNGTLIKGDWGIIKTANGVAPIQGLGLVTWHTILENGDPCVVQVPCYYAPEIPLRLFSPQDYARYHKLPLELQSMAGNANWFVFQHEASKKHFGDLIRANIDSQSGLFFFYADPSGSNAKDQLVSRLAEESQVPILALPHVDVNLSQNVHDPKNKNISSAQKRLLLDHQRLAHQRMSLIQQKLYTVPDASPTPLFSDLTPSKEACLQVREKEQLTCGVPLCETCQVAKARKRKTSAKNTKPDPERTDILRANDIHPGDCFSVDQYESSVRGRLPHTQGRERQSSRYCGGTLFYDHASRKIFVRHQVTLSGSETVDSKRDVEREALSSGVMVKKYQADNGVFNSRDFEDALEDSDQTIQFSGVGAKNQNGAAERAIGITQNMARAMLLHVRIHWPSEFDPALWPFALDYAAWIYNHTPQSELADLTPEELFSSTRSKHSLLRRCRVFGCPAYVLDAKLQDGAKIPKWKNRGSCGMFLGFSHEHSSTVGLILNLRTGNISPQYHVVYDERFETVTTDMMVDLSETWIDLWKNSRDFYLPEWDINVDGPFPALDADFQEASDEASESGKEGEAENDKSVVMFPPDTPKNRGVKWFDVEEAKPQVRPREDPDQSFDPLYDEESDDDSDAEGVVVDGNKKAEERLDDEWLEMAIENNDIYDPPAPSEPVPEPPSPTKRTRSGRSYKNRIDPQFRPIMSRTFSHIKAIQDCKNLLYATLDWESVPQDSLYKHFHSMFMSKVNRRTKELLDPDAMHPFSLSAKMDSEDYPSFKEILRMDSEERSKWFDSMDEELGALFESGACEFVDRQEVLRMKKEIIKTTWAFRKKRKPSGEVTRYKSRLCVRGDLQKAQGDYTIDETFAPVVEWMTVRLMFTLALVEGWHTASIDFKNAFTQAKLPEPIYLDLPPGFLEANPTYKDKAIRVKTSLYGERRAANLWYRKVRSTLCDDLHFKVSDQDPCLFIRNDCILMLYVDDAILNARNEASLQKVLQQLKDHGYDFNRDGDFKSYLGIQIEQLQDGALKLSQPHLAKSLIDTVGLADGNASDTPAMGPLFRFKDSKPFDRSFNYRSALGMLQYLGNNTRPDCAYSINACARYCIDPKEPHGAAVKRIARYLKGTADEGMIIKPDLMNLNLDCHVDADFAGNWNPADPEDPSAVKSRTGFLLTFAGVPILWKSKIQDCIALSTMESEYIALSTAMRSLIHSRALLFDICAKFNMAYGDRVSTLSTVFEDNRAAKILAETDPPRLTPRSKSLAVKYHWFRSHIGRNNGKGIVLEDVRSKLNKADFLTKALARDAFRVNRLAVCGW